MSNFTSIVIVAAAGSARRAELGFNKLLFKVGGRTILEHTLSKVAQTAPALIVVAASAQDISQIQQIASAFSNTRVVEGGKSRTESVKNALNVAKDFLTSNPSALPVIVSVHDGARPNASSELFLRCASEALCYGSAVPCVKPSDALMLEGKPLNRNSVVAVQTPQCFDFDKLYHAYSQVEGEYFDDAAVYCAHFESVHFCEGENDNFKITYQEDIERFCAGQLAVGCGYDIHRLEKNRPLYLCGVKIPSELGLLGHSDADVAVHALMDALLSAAGERDIGHHFPSTPEFKNANSMHLLKKVLEILAAKGTSPLSASIAIVAETPKLSPHINEMKTSLSAALGLPAERIGITATTAEGIGEIGSNKAISATATAVCSAVKNSPTEK